MSTIQLFDLDKKYTAIRNLKVLTRNNPTDEHKKAYALALTAFRHAKEQYNKMRPGNDVAEYVKDTIRTLGNINRLKYHILHETLSVRVERSYSAGLLLYRDQHLGSKTLVACKCYCDDLDCHDTPYGIRYCHDKTVKHYRKIAVESYYANLQVYQTKALNIAKCVTPDILKKAHPYLNKYFDNVSELASRREVNAYVLMLTRCIFVDAAK